jgi:hypothetical protein
MRMMRKHASRAALVTVPSRLYLRGLKEKAKRFEQTLLPPSSGLAKLQYTFHIFNQCAVQAASIPYVLRAHSIPSVDYGEVSPEDFT